jgi:cytoskeletal protein CcmA (bactofilin family)
LKGAIMWGKKPKIFEDEPTIVEAQPQAEIVPVRETPAPKAAASVIAINATINGSLESSGDIAIDGKINGDVNCALLTVGTNGLVSGNVSAQTATIRGKVLGNVTARTILLAGTGSIEGDLTHSVLIIEEGGVFEGRSKRVADPLATQTKALEAPIPEESAE